MTGEKTPDFLKKELTEGPGSDVLARLAGGIDGWRENEAEVARLEAELKRALESRRRWEQEFFPEMLGKYGLSRIRLASGEEISVSEDASVSISDHAAFIKFLKTRGEEDIIKLQLFFSRMDDEDRARLYEFLMERGYDYDVKYDVHASTRKKYFRDLLGVGAQDREEGVQNGRYLRPEDVATFAGVFVVRKTRIKNTEAR